MIKDLILTKSLFFILLAITILNIIWLSFSTISINFLTYLNPVVTILVAGIVNLFYRFIRPSFGIVTLTSAIIFFTLTSNILLVTSYLIGSATLPFQDNFFNQIDIFLNFDFEKTVMLVNSNATLVEIFKSFYYFEIYELFILALILSNSKPEYIIEFCHLFLITLCITFFLALIVPAIGPYEYLNIAPELMTNIGEKTGRSHVEVIKQLRSHVDFTLNFYKAVGLVSFPSFHIILAILAIYAMRGFKWLFYITISINFIIIIATIPIGGHYLIDLIAGAIIFFIVIWIKKKISKPNFEVLQQPL